MSFNEARRRPANDRPIARDGEYVLYWVQAYRRLSHNHALDYAIKCARELKRPLVVYEGLRLDYPWASERIHRFALEGMRANRAEAARIGLQYWPFVAAPEDPGRGLVRKIAARACMVVTDFYPCFVVPEQTEALARKTDRQVIAIDGNSVAPLATLGATVSAAAHLRPRIHKQFRDAWAHRAKAEPEVASVPVRSVEAPFATWDGDVDRTLAALPIDRSVASVRGVTGGAPAANERLAAFLDEGLARYADHRSNPSSPEDGPSSRLSPYLHFGHISVEAIVAGVLARAYGTPDIALGSPGKREGFYGTDPNVNGFLDQAITWRDVGFQWHVERRLDTASLARALPAWVQATLAKHADDPRKHVYTAEEWEAAATHDRLWNAAQTELARTGAMHNYMRMLWGKKVLEWSRTPEEAYRTLVHLNNKYALDGRDPSSYTGILWCFGLFDRPWAPERPVLGSIRYMSSDNTAKKFKLDGYLAYVRDLK